MAEITAPRRRCFQFTLATMFVLVAAVAIGAWRVAAWRDGNLWVCIAKVDPRSSFGLTSNLKSNDITYELAYGKGCYLMVHQRDEERARIALHRLKDANPMQIQFLP